MVDEDADGWLEEEKGDKLGEDDVVMVHEKLVQFAPSVSDLYYKRKYIYIYIYIYI